MMAMMAMMMRMMIGFLLLLVLCCSLGLSRSLAHSPSLHRILPLPLLLLRTLTLTLGLSLSRASLARPPDLHTLSLSLSPLHPVPSRRRRSSVQSPAPSARDAPPSPNGLLLRSMDDESLIGKLREVRAAAATATTTTTVAARIDKRAE